MKKSAPYKTFFKLFCHYPSGTPEVQHTDPLKSHRGRKSATDFPAVLSHTSLASGPSATMPALVRQPPASEGWESQSRREAAPMRFPNSKKPC